MNKNRWIVLVVLTLLSGCATRQVASEFNAEALQPHEGLLLLTLHHNNSKMKLFLKGKNHSVETPEFANGSNGMLLKLPADQYEVTLFYIGTRSFGASDFITLTVEPGHLTYPGDLIFNGRQFTLNMLLDDLKADLEGPYRQAASRYPLIIGSEVDHDRRWY